MGVDSKFNGDKAYDPAHRFSMLSTGQRPMVALFSFAIRFPTYRLGAPVSRGAPFGDLPIYRRYPWTYGWVLAISIACSGQFAVGQTQLLEVVPAAPRYQEPVYARIRSAPFDFGVPFAIQVAMNGTL